MAHDSWEFNEKVEKFKGKNTHECFKLIWQWIKQGAINLSLFEALCTEVTMREAIREQFRLHRLD